MHIYSALKTQKLQRPHKQALDHSRKIACLTHATRHCYQWQIWLVPGNGLWILNASVRGRVSWLSLRLVAARKLPPFNYFCIGDQQRISFCHKSKCLFIYENFWRETRISGDFLTAIDPELKLNRETLPRTEAN